MARATMSNVPATSRSQSGVLARRRLSSATGRTEDIPDAAERVDEFRFVSINFSTQIGDVRLDHVAVATKVVAPHMVEDLRFRQYPPLVGHEVVQQLELG